MIRVRVLQVFGEPFSSGGQEAFIMNMYENINRDNVQFDFFTPYYCDNANMKKRIQELGGNVFVCNKSFDKKRKENFKEQLILFLENNYYDIIHIHSGSTYVLANGAKIAKKFGINKVIVHSHIAGTNKIKSLLLKIFFSGKLKKNADYFFSCSRAAAEFKFPNKIIKENKYTVINNGIDCEKYSYNEEIRHEYREQFNFENCFVIGNVGRMENQKNQSFLIDVFNEISKIDETARLLLVGAGSLEQMLRNKIKDYDLESRVIILQNRSDVNKILQAVDVFAFPSIFEGLGIVAIEAQAAGLVTVCSEFIPEEANITELFKRVPISDGINRWVSEILKYKDNKRKDYSKKIIEAGYSAKESASKLEKIYLEERVKKHE